MRRANPLFVLVAASGLVLAACSDGGEDGVVGTWRAVADTAGPQPSVLYEFRPDHTLVLHMLARDVETEGTWLLGDNGGVRVEFGESSFLAGREVEGQLLAPDSLMLEIQGEERIFMPHDTAEGGSGS